MNILVIEDNKDVGRILRILLAEWDHTSGRNVVARVVLVENLAGAIEHLGEADVIVCDGEFPLTPDTGAAENWALVSYRASALGIPVIVYSGNPVVVHKAQACGLVAFGKPAPVQELYIALMAAVDQRAGARSSCGVGNFRLSI